MKRIALGALLAVAGGAHAATFNFHAYTNNSGISNQIDVNVQVSATANTLSFVISNNSTSGRMTTFYMENHSSLSGVDSGNWSVTDLVGSTNFVRPSGPPGPPDVTPPSPGGGLAPPPWGGNFFAMEPASPDQNLNSLNAGESLMLTFDHDGSFVLADLINAMTLGQLRLVQHYQSWGPGDNFSEWLVTVIPLPPAGWAGLATLGLIAGTRAARRRRPTA